MLALRSRTESPCSFSDDASWLNWFTVACKPPPREPCVCLTRPGRRGCDRGQVAGLGERRGVLTCGVPIPRLWFCWMSISMFGPPAALFCFCVIAPEPEAFDMIDWSCVSGSPSQVPPQGSVLDGVAAEVRVLLDRDRLMSVQRDGYRHPLLQDGGGAVDRGRLEDACGVAVRNGGVAGSPSG